MALPKLPLAIFTKSKQLISGEWANAITNLLTSSKTGITATAGGTAGIDLLPFPRGMVLASKRK